jgi:hypothetical protein
MLDGEVCKPSLVYRCIVKILGRDPSGEIVMAEKTLKSVFVDELRDLYNAEQQLIRALPKMAKTATSEELRKGFEEHLEQTKEHATRI